MSTISATPRSSVEVRDIPGYPGYAAARDGRIRGKHGRWLKPQYRRDGHCMIHPRVDGQEKWLSVSHAVLYTWVGPRPDGTEACHRDGDPANNHLDNVYWDTPSNNPSRHGEHTYMRGIRHHNAKLAEADVREIRSLLGIGMTMRAIAGEYGVGEVAIFRIKHGLTWSWLS